MSGKKKRRPSVKKRRQPSVKKRRQPSVKKRRPSVKKPATEGPHRWVSVDVRLPTKVDAPNRKELVLWLESDGHTHEPIVGRWDTTSVTLGRRIAWMPLPAHRLLSPVNEAAPAPPAAPVQLGVLESKLQEKARAQATKEWGELEISIHGWFEAHPTTRTKLHVPPPAFWSGARPLLQLQASPGHGELETHLRKLAVAYVEDRTRVLVNHMATELLKKMATETRA